MKKSALFWFIITSLILSLPLILSPCLCKFFIVYFIYFIIALYIQIQCEYTIFDDEYEEDICIEKVKILFLNLPYLFFLPHLFILGVIISFYLIFNHAYQKIKKFNSYIDNIGSKPPHKTYSEFKKDI